MGNSRSSEKLSKSRRVAAPKSGDFSLTRKTTDVIPGLPLARMKERILGPAYNCSLVIVGDAESRRLNEAYRRKTYTPNVLSFPLAKGTGEIFLNMKEARRQMKDPSGIPATRNLPLRSWTALLIIHAMLHLKGMKHGSTMEKTEAQYLKEFQ